MFTAETVQEALRVCFDAVMRVEMVDLGLVQKLGEERDEEAPGVDARWRVWVRRLARTADENREAMLTGQVQNRLLGLRVVSRAAVEVATEPTWTPERMSDAARRQLGLGGPPKQGLVSIKL